MLPAHAPFDTIQIKLLEQLLPHLDQAQRFWLSGFLASNAVPSAVKSSASAAGKKLQVLFGTESGNAEGLADRAVKAAKKLGFKASMKNMSETSPQDLKEINHLLVIVSTWGDGEPPETATSFYNSFMTETHDLSAVQFSVCALGDTSYEKFCQTGKEIDARLEVLGAKRVHARQDCDVDYEEAFEEWLKLSLQAFAPTQTAPVLLSDSAPITAGVEYGKKNPFPSEVLDKVLLNGEGSKKETWHLEFALEGSGMSYEPGDALAVQPVNAPDVVQAVLKASKLQGTESVEVKSIGKKLLADALREDLDITALSKNVLTKLQTVCPSQTLEDLLKEENKEQLKQYIYGREIVDAIEDFAPKGLSADALCGILRKLPVRLYSIASSPLAHPDEVHLTVAAVRYDSHGKQRKGVCSTFLGDLAHAGSSVNLFIQPNKNFRLPEDGNIPIIMIGPGTGIAPFRAFIEHRSELGHSGKNWLFFGDQHYMYDFLYQLEWQDYLKNGVLNRLDVAFSRDQPEKIYVQDKMLAAASDLYQWLLQGAHLYVCGDASRMAHDVHQALILILQQQGNHTQESAEAFLEEMKKSKRYQRDVY